MMNGRCPVRLLYRVRHVKSITHLAAIDGFKRYEPLKAATCQHTVIRREPVLHALYRIARRGITYELHLVCEPHIMHHSQLHAFGRVGKSALYESNFIYKLSLPGLGKRVTTTYRKASAIHGDVAAAACQLVWTDVIVRHTLHIIIHRDKVSCQSPATAEWTTPSHIGGRCPSLDIKAPLCTIKDRDSLIRAFRWQCGKAVRTYVR